MIVGRQSILFLYPLIPFELSIMTHYTLNIEWQKAVELRHSVRTFDAERRLTSITLECIEGLIADAFTPFGGNYSLRLSDFSNIDKPLPSTYGSIKGTSVYIVAASASDLPSLISLGFAGEQVVLRAALHDLGTCWVGGTFKASDFRSVAELPEAETLRLVMPVGYAADRRRLREKITSVMFRSTSRKPFDRLFYAEDFSTPVPPDSPFRRPLEMMRLAPSSLNSQPWRALVRSGEVVFYYKGKGWMPVIDMGIALCHFYFGLPERLSTGAWHILSQTHDSSQPDFAAESVPTLPGFTPIAIYRCP